MRPRNRAAGRIAGALCIATTTAAALPVGAAAAPSTPVLRLADDTVTAGTAARVRGTAPGAAGRTVILEHRAGAAPWTRVGETTVGAGGGFALKAHVPRTGVLRATIAPTADVAVAVVASTTNEQPIRVARAVRVAKKRVHVVSGRRARVTGTVTPVAAGLPVSLQARHDGRWRTLARDRTTAAGRYALRDRLATPGTRPLRVVTAGADGFSRGARGIGPVHVYRVANASWYGPGLYGSPLGCGGAPLQVGQLGVANKYLPCGTKVTFRHAGRSVTVPVIDRGPFVAGREYDLTAATAQAIGFTGHGPLLATR